MAGNKGKLQSTPAVTFLKLLLTVFNTIFLMSGVAVLALGVWMKVQLYVYMELTTVYYHEAPYVLMCIGAGIIVVGVLGCCCTVKGYHYLLYLFATLLMVVFVAELGVAIASFVYKNKLSAGFKKGMDEAIVNYEKNAEKRKALDGLQQALKCCGDEGYTDWFSTKWEGKQTKANSVPKSCCKVAQDKCTNTGLPATNSSGTVDVYTEGCVIKITSFMQNNFLIIGGVAIGFSFIQLFGAVLACYLGKNIKRLKYKEVN